MDGFDEEVRPTRMGFHTIIAGHKTDERRYAPKKSKAKKHGKKRRAKK